MMAARQAPEQVRNCFQQRSRWATGARALGAARGAGATVMYCGRGPRAAVVYHMAAASSGAAGAPGGPGDAAALRVACSVGECYGGKC